MVRKFGPRDNRSDWPVPTCPACDEEFKEGDYTTLIAVGPGDDPEEQARRDAGEPYNSVAVEVHWDCSPYTEGDLSADGAD